MKILRCPKCHTQEIVRLPADITPTAMLSGSKHSSSFKRINATRYCCSNCGYSEVWVDDPHDLKELLQKFGF